MYLLNCLIKYMIWLHNLNLHKALWARYTTISTAFSNQQIQTHYYQHLFECACCAWKSFRAQGISCNVIYAENLTKTIGIQYTHKQLCQYKASLICNRFLSIFSINIIQRATLFDIFNYVCSRLSHRLNCCT